MRKKLLPILAGIIIFMGLGGCVYEYDEDLWTHNVYPLTTNTYTVGSPTYQYSNGYFQTITIGGVPFVGGGGYMTKAIYDPNDDAVIAIAQLDNLVIVEGDIDDIPVNGEITAPISSNWAFDHDALTTGIHGVGAGSVVGTTLVQELDNKTLDSSVGKGTWTASGTWKLPDLYLNGDITSDRWLNHVSNTFLGTDVVGGNNLAHTGAAEGYYNTAIGHFAGYSLTTGCFNNIWGSDCLFYLTTGNGNTGFGVLTGNKVTTGSYNTMIGYMAGPTANANYGLYIDIGETDTPLISGNFSQNWVAIFNKLGIGIQNPSAEIHLAAGTAAAGGAPLKMTAGTLLTNPEAGVLEYDGTGIYLTNTNHRRFISQAADSIITPQTVANTIVKTTVFTATLNANELKVHRVYRLSFYGKFSTYDASDTITVNVDVNGTTLVTLTSSPGVVTDAPFHGEAVFTVRSTGAGGTISAHGDLMLDNEEIHTNTSSVAVDTTAINYSTLKFQWDSADAGNTITLDQAFMEVLD